MKKGVKMVDMSIHDVSGVVGWCLVAYSEVENTICCVGSGRAETATALGCLRAASFSASLAALSAALSAAFAAAF